MNREAVYQGVYDYIRAAVGADAAVTWSRQLQHWNDVPGIRQPAIFFAQTGEELRTDGVRVLWRCGVEIYIYTTADNNADTVSATGMNRILDQITAAVMPRSIFGERDQTLGGLVVDCKIAGKIETDAGTLGRQSVAIVPLSILVEE
jgi:hypothetical protein